MRFLIIFLAFSIVMFCWTNRCFAQKMPPEKIIEEMNNQLLEYATVTDITKNSVTGITNKEDGLSFITTDDSARLSFGSSKYTIELHFTPNNIFVGGLRLAVIF
ncbi:hypothetical protein ACQ33O_10235 [Ferruginibacter sp. SUN002]|uniref:hypothetical protein n=1 Tax=Ferruginibacter sp. SUN002 TaxID=2937789 RepID=UPI003D362BCF